jgi:hypothetical protein
MGMIAMGMGMSMVMGMLGYASVACAGVSTSMVVVTVRPMEGCIAGRRRIELRGASVEGQVNRPSCRRLGQIGRRLAGGLRRLRRQQLVNPATDRIGLAHSQQPAENRLCLRSAGSQLDACQKPIESVIVGGEVVRHSHS